MNFTIWHNPRCRKSREALQILEEAGVTPEIRKYLENPPSETELLNVLKMLNLSPIEITRTKEKLFKKLGLNKTDAEEKILKALAENPKLIERAIVINNKTQKAALGRPPENVKELL